MGQIIGKVIGIIWEAVDVALANRKSFKEALADGFEEAAGKIRSGELNIDDAVAQAKADSAKLQSIRDKFQ